MKRKIWIGVSVGVLVLAILFPLITSLKSDQPISYKKELDKPIDLNGTTMLMKAVQDNDVVRVKNLLKAGANPNTVDKFGETALIFATILDHPDIGKVLLDAKSDPNLKRKDGLSPTMIAANVNRSDMLKQDVKAGGDINAKDLSGNTPFIMETIKILVGDERSIEPLKTLVAEGADINVRNKFGHTALSMAVEKKNKALVKFLKSLGAKGETRMESQIPPSQHENENAQKKDS